MDTERVLPEHVLEAAPPPPPGKNVLLQGKSILILTKRYYYTRALGGRKEDCFLFFHFHPLWSRKRPSFFQLSVQNYLLLQKLNGDPG
jgi:hypothetical protein